MPSAPKKTCRLIVESGNHYLGALKGNQGNLHQSVQANFVVQQSYTELGKGHGRIEHRVVSLCTTLDNIPDWPGLQTLIQVESERRFKKGGQLRVETETRYYVFLPRPGCRAAQPVGRRRLAGIPGRRPLR